MKFGLIFEKQLSSQANYLIAEVGRIANDLKQSVYLVGGAVRDVLLERSSNDLDFVTEGDGIKLAQAVCLQLGGGLTAHDRFGTAVWVPPAELFNFTIDFITARQETYAHPAALPNVSPSHMSHDLLRRDFTVNALAVRLDGTHFGELHDGHGGQVDLENKLIRILHPQSFADDPTRIFRALRYAHRLGFELSPETISTLKEHIDKITLVSADRLRHEFEKILGEADPAPILQSLKDFGILAQVSDQIDWNKQTEAALIELMSLIQAEPGLSAVTESGLVHLRFLGWVCASNGAKQAAEAFAQSLNFSADLQQDLAKVIQFLKPTSNLQENQTPGVIEKAFRTLSASQLVVLQLVDFLPPSVKKLIPIYFTDWQHVKTIINGNTLKQMGLQPGPQYKVILNSLLEAKLNGQVDTEKEEIAFVKALIK